VGCTEALTVLLCLREWANVEAGLASGLHLLSLSHSSAGCVVQGEVTLYQVARLLGHSSTAVTEKHGHFVPSAMQGVFAPLSHRSASSTEEASEAYLTDDSVSVRTDGGSYCVKPQLC
jgi:hypothetical protein